MIISLIFRDSILFFLTVINHHVIIYTLTIKTHVLTLENYYT